MVAIKIFTWFYQKCISKMRLNVQMDKNFKNFQHSALLFGQRLNFFKYSVGY